MTAIEKLLDKIAKLHEHAESAGRLGNVAEAAAFSEKVIDLLREHKLSMTQVERIKDEEYIDFEYINFEKHGLPRKHKRVGWTETLAGVVARHYECCHVVACASNKIGLIGQESNRAIAEYIFVVLARLGTKVAAKAYIKLRKKAYADGETFVSRGFRNSFLRGFVNEIAARLEEIKIKTAKPISPGTSLMRTDQLTKWKKAHGFRNTGGMGFGSNANDAGFDQGEAAGRAADLRANALNRSEARGPRLLGE